MIFIIMKKYDIDDARLEPEFAEKERIQLLPFLALAPMPTEVIATNLELRAGEIAMKVARRLNEKYRSSCVEVLRKTQTNARDGGEDIEVLFDKRIWTSNESFMNEFLPMYKKFGSEQ